MSWCLYQLIYFISIGFVTFGFLAWAILNIIFSFKSNYKKILALHFVALLMNAVGFFIAEYLINMLGPYNCNSKEYISMLAMIVSAVFILLVCWLVRNNKYLINIKTTNSFALLNVLVIAVTIFLIIIPNWSDYAGLFELLFYLPFEAVRVIFTGKH